jgi:hypothetical protein
VSNLRLPDANLLDEKTLFVYTLQFSNAKDILVPLVDYIKKKYPGVQAARLTRVSYQEDPIEITTMHGQRIFMPDSFRRTTVEMGVQLIHDHYTIYAELAYKDNLFILLHQEIIFSC